LATALQRKRSDAFCAPAGGKNDAYKSKMQSRLTMRTQDVWKVVERYGEYTHPAYYQFQMLSFAAAHAMNQSDFLRGSDALLQASLPGHDSEQ
jgi:hypothetical protein